MGFKGLKLFNGLTEYFSAESNGGGGDSGLTSWNTEVHAIDKNLEIYMNANEDVTLYQIDKKVKVRYLS